MHEKPIAARVAGGAAEPTGGAASRRRLRSRGIELLGCALLVASTGFAQSSKLLPAALSGGDAQPAAPAGSPATLQELTAQFQAKLAQAQEDLNRVPAAQDDAAKLPAGATAAEVIEYRAALQSLVQTYRLHLNDLAALEAIRQRTQDLDRRIQTWTGFAEPPPYSVLLVDDLRNAVHALTLKIDAAESERATLEMFVAEGQAAMQASDGKLRRISEEMETAGAQSAATRLTWQRTLAQARSRAIAAGTAYYEGRRHTTAEELAELRRRLAFTQRQHAVAAQYASFPQTDLDTVLESLARERAQLDLEIQTAETELQMRQKALAGARAENARAVENQADAGAAREAQLRRLSRRVDLENARVETSAERIIALRQAANFINLARDLWQMRFAGFESQDLAKIQDDGRRLNRWDRILQVARPYFAQQIELAAHEIAAQHDRLQGGADADDDSAFERDLAATYRQREESYRRTLQSLDRAQQLVRSWKESLDLARGSLPLGGRVRDLLGGAASLGAKLWNFELFVVEDTITVDGQPITGRRSVTVGKIIMAILILIIGYWIASLIARMLERTAVRRLKIDRNQAHMIGRWVRVVLVIVLVFFSLVSVKIPLTVLAFAGGALAIGVGFGTQNILKNFISGIIILLERPFRVGHVLDVGGQRGVVTGIGFRSSVIQRWDHTEVIIPNSVLLETNVTNWTLSNHAVRFTVAVGVAYGSDTRRVATLLAEAVDRHGLVLKDPKPQVYFTEFADSALVFEVRYWINVLLHNAAQIGSDLRHMIAAMAAEHGIAMPFPQRDVHVTTGAPIAITLTAPEPPGGRAAPPSP